LLFSQQLIDKLNNNLQHALYNKNQFTGKIVFYSTDFNKEYWGNPEKINFDTLIYFDEDKNILLSAISLNLFDDERFNINSYLNALIPGSTEPYLPNSDDYNIPFKNEMTAKDLLQQRSGLFNIIDKYKFEHIKFLLADSNCFVIIDSMAAKISKGNLYNYDPNIRFKYNKFNFYLLLKILNRIKSEKIINEIEQHIKYLINKDNYKIGDLISFYNLAMYYKNLITNEMVIPKRLINNYLLYPSPINNYYIEYAMGCFYYKNIGYGNISVNDNSVRISVYLPKHDIFLLFYIFDLKINKEDELNSKEIITLLELISKIEL